MIVSGRIAGMEEELKNLGADYLISTEQKDKDFIKELEQVNENTPFDIVLDYLWGHSSELIISHLSGKGFDSYA